MLAGCRVFGGQFDKDGTVYQRLTVFSHRCNEGGHILKVGFRGDCLLHPVGTAPVHPVLVLGVMEDLFLLRRGHLPGIDAQGHAALFSKVPKQSQFLCGSGVAAQCHRAAVEVPAHRMIRVEANRGGSNQVQKILWLRFWRSGLCRPFLFLLLFLRHIYIFAGISDLSWSQESFDNRKVSAAYRRSLSSVSKESDRAIRHCDTGGAGL